ncbi:MAG: response regulator [Minicystis sp.]
MKDTQIPLLVIDDDRDVRDAVVESLTDEGYGALEAENGAKALALLRNGARLPCVILLDMMMPVMDGPTFRAAQLDDPRLRGIPVVIMSASPRIESVATDLEATGFLRKPLQLSDLLAVAERFCSAPG